MIISDRTLRELLASGDLVVDPLDDNSIQPASIDCRLDRHFLTVEHHSASAITLDSELEYREYEGDAIILPPQSFLLATTVERFKLPCHLTAFVEGRSSIGRIGLFIQNAGWVDPGFEGRITLELYNANSLPIELRAGRRICQLVFCRLDQSASAPYNGKYKGQQRPMGSRIHLDPEAREPKKEPERH